MELNVCTIYWIMTLDDIRFGLHFFGLIFGLSAGAITIFVIVECFAEQEYEHLRALLVTIPLLILASATLFIPTSKTVCSMYALPTIVGSDIAKEISKDSKEIYKIGVKALKEKMESLIKEEK